MQNIPWGLQITAIGMGMVFLMLLILMGSLMIMTGLDKPPAEIEEADETPAIAAAPLAAAAGGMSDAELAAIAVAIHTAQAGGNAPALVANQSGSGLTDSRWVAVGRSLHTTTWQRS